MKWHSIGEFIAMGGYAFYIWGSYGLTALLIALEVVLVYKRQRTARRNLDNTVPTQNGN